MLVFLQRLWVMIVVDGFLLYIIIRLLREKTEVKKEEKKVGPAPKPEKYIGRLLDYEFRDEHGRTQSGSIKSIRVCWDEEETVTRRLWKQKKRTLFSGQRIYPDYRNSRWISCDQV